MQKARCNPCGPQPLCKHVISGSLNSPYRGSFHHSVALLVHYRSSRSTQPWRVVPPCSGRISRVRPYSRANQLLHYRTITFFGWPFNAIRAVCWLIRVRSALLTESLLLSFPLATKMFQFTRFASHGLYIQPWMTHKSRVAPFGNPRITTWLPVPLGLSQVPTSFIAS